MPDERPDDDLEMRLLIQADLDGELTPAEAARVAAHLERSPADRAEQARLFRLSADLRAGIVRVPAPESLRQAVRTAARAAVPARPRTGPRWLAAGAGLALAACVLLFAMPSGRDRLAGDALAGLVVADHIRSLQPGHLTDVVSTDQHTVKPWFDGRLDFAPPVVDGAAQGFPLAGGRLDYLDGHAVAALVYRRRGHVVQLFVWPEPDGRSAAPRSASVAGNRQGYNFVRWTENGMSFWAVSDLNPAELADFTRLW